MSALRLLRSVFAGVCPCVLVLSTVLSAGTIEEVDGMWVLANDRQTVELASDGAAVGIVGPGPANWYGSETLTVHVQGVPFFVFQAERPAAAPTTTMAIEAGDEPALVARQTQGETTVSLRWQLPEGAESVRLTVQVESPLPRPKIEVRFQAYPGTRAPRDRLQRGLRTARRAVVISADDPGRTIMLGEQESWIVLLDHAFPAGTDTGDGPAAGPCALHYVPAECESARVNLGPYHVDPVFVVRGGLKEAHFALREFADTGNDVATAAVDAAREDWLMPFTRPQFAFNLLPPPVSAMDAPAALESVRYLRDTGGHPEEWYRLVHDGAYKGDGCLEVVARGEQQIGVLVGDATGQFAAGDPLVASAYLRADVPMQVMLFIWVPAPGPELAAQEQLRQECTIGPDWRQCVVRGVLARPTDRVRVLIRSAHPDDTRRVFRADEIKIERGHQPSPSVGDAHAAAVARPPLSVPLCAAPPKLDGILDDPAWRQALRLDHFTVNDRTGAPAPQENVAWLTFDDAYVYMAARCAEQKLNMLSNLSPGRDRPDWSDDRIEFFLDGLGTERWPIYYFSVNAFGMVADQLLPFGDWQPDYRLATGRETAAWTLEMAWPIADLGRDSLRGQRWTINVGRHHRGSVRTSSSFARIDGSFSEVAHYVPVVFQPLTAGDPEVICVSRGEMSRFGDRLGTNEVAYRVRHRGAPVALTCEVTAGGETRRDTVEVTTDGQEIRQLYSLGPGAGQTLAFRVADAAGTTLFEAAHKVDAIRPLRRVHEVADPVFEEVLDRAQPKDPRRNGDMLWCQPFGIFLNCVQSGTAYDRFAVRQECSDLGMHPLLQYSPPLPLIWEDSYVLRDRDTWPRLAAATRANGWGGLVLFAPYYIVGLDENNQPGGRIGIFGELLDPVNRQAFVESVRAVVREYGDVLWAVHAGDEQYARVMSNTDNFYRRTYDPDNPDHAFFTALGERVKHEAGFGKYGLPHRLDATDPSYPFCLRAWQTFVANELRRANREMAAAVEEEHPGMLVIGQDSHGGRVIDTEYWAEYSQVGAFQAQHHGGPDSQPYAYAAKLARDVSGLDYIQVVLHDCVAGFPLGALTPAELRELYSQVFRGGATGFDWWPGAMGAKEPAPPLAGATNLGYPLAWRSALAAARLARDLPQLRRPLETIGVYVSSESRKCGAGTGARQAALFNAFGPVAAGWFRFFSDGTIELGKADFPDFDAVVIANVRYTLRERADALVDYVRGGGTVICFDARALSWCVDGTDLAAQRRELFGVGAPVPRQAVRLRGVAGWLAGRELAVDPAKEPAFDFTDPAPELRVLATYEDGKPAVVEHRLGQGRAVLFGWCPLHEGLAHDPAWLAAMTALYAELGGPRNVARWRFLLPELAADDREEPTDWCLTNNQAEWDIYRFIDGHRNVATGGSYRIEEAGHRWWRRFPDGPLTNRRHTRDTWRYGDVHGIIWNREFDMTYWAETFSGAEPATITFDFNRPYPLTRVAAWTTGACPGGAVEASIDAQTWTPLGALPAAPARDQQVRRTELPLAPTGPMRYLRLRLEPGDAPYAIAEMEVWSRDQ